MTDRGILLIRDYNGDFVSGYEMTFVKNLYDYPYASSELSIGYYKMTTTLIKNVKPTNKCIAVPEVKKSLYLIFPYASEEHFS